MAPWLIIALSLFAFFVFFVVIIKNYVGRRFLKTLRKDSAPLTDLPNVDLSFYEKGPHKEAAKRGREYLDACESEIVETTSFDQTKLSAYFYPSSDKANKKIMLGMHGFKSNPKSEFGPFAAFYRSRGFALLLPDQRAGGLSGGDFASMGVKERCDVLAWISFAVQKFGPDIKILLHGVSMGAATVLNASGENLPKQVIGIVSDCAYTSNKEEITFQMTPMIKKQTAKIVQICEKYAEKYAGFDFTTITPEKQVARASVPILFVHGENDSLVPPSFAPRLYNACKTKKKLLIVKNANHAESVAANPDLYFQTIREFFNV